MPGLLLLYIQKTDSIHELTGGRYISVILGEFRGYKGIFISRQYRNGARLANLHSAAKQPYFPPYTTNSEERLELRLLFPMTSSGPHIRGTPITENYPPPFIEGYETLDTYEDHTTIFYPIPDFDTIPPLQEADYEGQQLLPNGYGNWLSNYDSGFADSWCDGFFSHSCNSDHINGSGGSMVKTEDDHQMQAQYKSDYSYYEDSENQPTFDYNACYDSCFAYTEGEEEARSAYRYGLDEIKFCEGIFGYWPCMYRELQQAYDEQ